MKMIVQGKRRRENRMEVKDKGGQIQIVGRKAKKKNKKKKKKIGHLVLGDNIKV
jgi:hypothetical protein